MSTVNILILTALEIEREAVIKFVSNKSIIYHDITGTDYVIGECNSKNGIVKVAVARTDQTNINAAIETERAIDFLNPKYVFFVGVAGGLKDTKIGDVVIGTEVIGYERGKADIDLKIRAQFGASSYDLERTAAVFAQSDIWKEEKNNLINTTFTNPISVFTGVIVSGEKVVSSSKATVYKSIQQIASHALAVEMEGLGFLKVCMARPSIKSLLLRGISDLIDNKGEMDGKGSQQYASTNVAAFLFGLIKELEVSVSTLSLRWTLFEIVCKLYPRGIEDKALWDRAGGDLSMINYNTTGKEQWAGALRLLDLGGGGSISFSSLIAEMKKDFSNNHDLKFL